MVVVKPERPLTVRLVMVVVAKVEVALTVSPEVVLKVNKDDVATGLVPLPNKMSLAVKAGAPVPPLATGRMPVTLVVRSTADGAMSAVLTKPLNRAPPLVERTRPAVVREDRVVEPLTVS